MFFVMVLYYFFFFYKKNKKLPRDTIFFCNASDDILSTELFITPNTLVTELLDDMDLNILTKPNQT